MRVLHEHVAGIDVHKDMSGRPRQLGSESERARLNVTRAIRTAISRIRDRAPDAAAHLDRAVRTGTRCSYSPPNRQS